MRRTIYYFLCYLILALLFGCSDDMSDMLSHQLDNIKQYGDTDPAKALTELYSLEADVKESGSDYVYYKFLLLKARLQDKAYIMPLSSDTIEAVTNYFSKHGDEIEQMESFYYQASAYRDQKDYPRAIMSFSQVLDVAHNHNVKPCVLLQNTYSQLAWLYNKQFYPKKRN